MKISDVTLDQCSSVFGAKIICGVHSLVSMNINIKNNWNVKQSLILAVITSNLTVHIFCKLPAMDYSIGALWKGYEQTPFRELKVEFWPGWWAKG